MAPKIYLIENGTVFSIEGYKAFNIKFIKVTLIFCM